ncbi:MAG: 8-amino-7-oxononanoate synthase [Solirubrobacteraceae bacterium]|nr:8-amino-7-oxononanoate synthase [Solirubrobacteraceae bacterium]
MASTTRDVFAKAIVHERTEQLRDARAADLLPYFRTLEGPAGPVVEMEGAERIMLGSNNYLGLTGDERVIAGAQAALNTYGTGLTGSRLLNGTIALHLELEQEIAEWMGTEEAIVFTTGHQANLAALGTLLAPGDTVVADSGDHASILDGCLLSRAKLRVFRHNRLDKLERALEKAAADGGGILVVVDGVFSLEGDVAPLGQIAELCGRFGARLMVDEAHGAGVLGARGAGASELLGVEDRVDLRMGTFSKSLASCGGFIAGSHEVVDYLRVQSRAFLFTAAGVPAAVGAALAALRIVRSTEGPPLLARVLDNAAYLHAGLQERGFRVVEHEGDHMTPIVPVMVGDDWKAVLLWRALYDEGVFVNVAIHPAVAPGGALLRTSVMATHDHATLDRALDAFSAVKDLYDTEDDLLSM